MGDESGCRSVPENKTGANAPDLPGSSRSNVQDIDVKETIVVPFGGLGITVRLAIYGSAPTTTTTTTK